MTRRALTIALLCVLAVWLAPSASADFPYVPAGGDPHNPSTWKLPPGVAPSNFGDDWKLAATPEQSVQSDAQDNFKQDELCGVRGASVVDKNATFPAGTNSCIPAGSPVNTAFEVTTGRPDVLISVLDSGIEWNDQGAMVSLRKKVRLNPGELPAPRVDLTQTFDPSTGVNCQAHYGAVGTGGDYNANGAKAGPGGSIPYDVINQGVFNALDYACDSRVAAVVTNQSSGRHGPGGFLTPEDLIIAFSDGIDHDNNGFANDIAGWNFVDNTNDPYDDVQYGHGTGEAKDSNGEANVDQKLGTCPNCMVMPLRVGESFIADDNRFAQAVLYATDSGTSVVQEALGTLNNSLLARDAVNYAYDHGVAVIASAADEAAEHHNQPAALPHVIVVNSVVKYDSTFTSVPPSYLQINGCTNFGTKITLSIPSSSCSSEATGRSAGVAGLVYSAALNACGAALGGSCASGAKLQPASDCTRVDGSPCPITANEVRQLMASGNIADTKIANSSPSGGKAPADAGNGGQADEVNLGTDPDAKSCTPAPTPACTDPNVFTFAPDQNGGIVGPLPDTRRYPARKGFNEFYGYGRLNAYKAAAAVDNATIPPEAEITSPDWFQQLDPNQPKISIDGAVNARVPYTCRVYVAPGAEPNNGLSTDTPSGDFAAVASEYCDGQTVHSSSYSGQLGSIDTQQLESRFPANVKGFDGNENGGLAQDSNGRPNTQPYAFTVRVVVQTAQGTPMTGQDRRQFNLHRDQDMLPGFPVELRSDGASSPLLVDLDGDNRNELVVATSDGFIHAYRPDGSELPGYPVHTDSPPLHAAERAYQSDSSLTNHYGAVLGALAAGDLFGDGRIEIVADDNQGKVYAWDSEGNLVFKQEANPGYSGAPLSGTPSWANVRTNPRDRTEHGFLSSPVLAHLDGNRSGPLDILAAGEDRHVYAWQPDPSNVAGSAMPGFPVLVVDPDKITSVDSTTNHLTFSTTTAQPNPGIDEDQGKIIDTPAVANIDGSGKPSIIVGSNEEYGTGTGDEGQINAGNFTSATLGLLGKGLLSFANGRVYAIKPTGGQMTCSAGTCHSSAFVKGWPKKVGIIDRGLLPDVGEGINGSPVVARLTCPNGGSGPKIGVTPDAGPAYIFNADGSSCYGTDQSGHDNTLETDFSAGHGQYDHPAFAAVGYPAFGTLDGQTTDFFAPQAGLIRAVDVVAPEYQGGQDFVGAWNPNTAQQRPGFPAEVNDLQFLTGPVVGDILGLPGQQQVLEGTSSLDLAAFNAGGLPASSAWPKLTDDWTIATPALGSFGTLDTSADAHKDVVSITRTGTLAVYSTPASACSPSSSPRFHHDNWNSGDSSVDAVPPGEPMNVKVTGHGKQLHWVAPGDDLLCGTASRYEVVTSASPITPANFSQATPVPGAPQPAPAGTEQSFKLPAGTQGYVAIRAVDAAANVGLPAAVQVT